ncbi:AAA family ATPase [Streptomyces sp. NPDC000594]|uniref:ATP-binding protein n=1 Tax=Streptomyces sp. NPDC000594 TaxID=3154261 RepID=UPI003330C210
MSGAPHGGGTPSALLGRDEVLGVLRARLVRAGAGQGGLVLITGEAGIGKTSLAGWTVREARSRDMTVLRGSCWGADGTPGYWPWTQVIRGLCAPGPDGSAPATAGTEGVVRRILLDGGAGAEEADPFQLFDAVTTMLVTAAQRRPVLIVLEDIHWADPASVALLGFLVQHLSLERVLTVATCRDTEIDRPDHPARDRLLSLMTRSTTLPLPGLGTADVAELMRRTAGREPDDTVTAEVLRRTGGNPFFVQEMTRLWAVGHSMSGLSPGLHASLRQRLELLDGAVVACLGAASVLGRRFHPGTLAGVSGAAPARVRHWLARAADAQLVETEPSGRVVFKHDLVRETLYAGLDPVEVRRLHAAAVRALRDGAAGAAAAPDVPLPVELARHAHCALGELAAEEAVALMLDAARHAQNRLAHEEAVGHYGRALERLGDTAPVRRVLIGLDLGLALQFSGEHRRSWEVFGEAAAGARELGDPLLIGRTALTLYSADERGDTALLTSRALGWARDRLVTTDRPEAEAAAGPEPDAGPEPGADPDPGADEGEREGDPRASLWEPARRVAAAVVAGARAAGDDDTLYIGLWARLQTEWEPGSAGARRGLAAELIGESRRRGDRWTEHVAMSMRWVAALEADDPRCRDDLSALASVADADGSPRLRLTSLLDRSVMGGVTGGFAEAEELLDASEALRSVGTDPYAFFVSHHRWALRMLRGAFPEARRQVEVLRSQRYPYTALVAALTELEAGGRPGVPVPLPGSGAGGDTLLHRSVTPLWLRYQAQAAAVSGDPEWCDSIRDSLAPYTGQWLVSLLGWDISGPAALWLGVLDAARRRWEPAVRHLGEAIRSADRMDALPWSLRARLELAAVLRARGTDDDRLAALLGEAEERARRLGVARPRACAERAVAGPPVASVVPDRPPGGYEFRRVGEVWRLTYEDRTVHLPDAKGLRDLHRLLSLPGQDIAAVRLLDPDGGTAAAAHPAGAGGPLDAEARERYRRRLERLDAEIDRAVVRGQEERAAAYDRERAALLEEVRRCTGAGGRHPRRPDDPRERARKNVAARIRDTLRRLDERHPGLAAHLRGAVATGTMCRYTPDREIRWRL